MALTHPSTELVEAAERKPRRRARRFGLVAVCLAIAVSAGVLTGCESLEAERLQVIQEVNASRAAAGIPAVKENVTLDIKADKWAQKMRNACKIWHSKLSDGAPDNWRKLGENVGRGGSIDQVHVAYMESPGHKANVLDPAFNQMGAAAVWGDCGGFRTVFTVHVFMKG